MTRTSSITIGYPVEVSFNDYIHSFKNNNFISCYSLLPKRYTKHDTKYAISLHYYPILTGSIIDYSPGKTVEISHNNFHGRYLNGAISLRIPGLTEAIIDENEYYKNREYPKSNTSSTNDRDAPLAIFIDGIIHSVSSKFPALINIINNSFVNPGYSIIVNGRLQLCLTDNKLIGDKGALAISPC